MNPRSRDAPPLKLEVRERLADLDPNVWNALVGDGSPFLEWAWLASLEESGCVGRRTGWLPRHLTLWDGARLIGACPLYLKGHSQGEFVFDHGWAEAAERSGIMYYPKLLVAVPFTPASGLRFLTHPGVDRTGVIRILAQALTDICRRSEVSSVHVNFCLPDEAEVLRALGFEPRSGYQFHWINQGWRTFEEYLSAFRSKRRTQIKRERRELASQGIDITVHTGGEIPDQLFVPMFELYKSTVDKLYWGRQYLNPDLFDRLRRHWKHRLCFVVARRRGQVIAGTFNVRKGQVLYGRYWGTYQELRFLHFNVCYYAAIDYCLREGIRRFEPGAGGEFKYLRGFDAQPQTSMHFITDAHLAAAVRASLRREHQAVAQEIAWLDQQSPLRK